jgi:hypothetical protein
MSKSVEKIFKNPKIIRKAIETISKRESGKNRKCSKVLRVLSYIPTCPAELPCPFI